MTRPRLLVLTVLHLLLLVAQALGLPAKHEEDLELKFFQRIQGLNLPWEEIVGSYKNVSAEVETSLCKSKCKTAAALWVLQDLRPCEKIEKVDCPKGLVCCTSSDSAFSSALEKEGFKIRSTQSPSPNVPHDIIMQDDIPDVSNDSSEQHPVAMMETEDEGVTPVTDLSHKLEERDDFYYPEPILDPIPNDEFP